MEVSLKIPGCQQGVRLHYTSLRLFVSRLRITPQLSSSRRTNVRNSKRTDELFARLYMTTLRFVCSRVTSVPPLSGNVQRVLHTIQRALAELQIHQGHVGVSNKFTRTSKRGLE